MGKNLEENLLIPSPVKTIERASMKSPLLQEALTQIKNREDRENFLQIFRKYLLDSYYNNPKMRRLMKSHDLTEKVSYSPENEDYDERSVLNEQLYSEPGRRYHYTNNFLGSERKKKGLLRRLYDTTKDLTFETLPGIVGLGGWYGANRWYTKKAAEEAAKEALATRAGKKILGGIGDAFGNMKWWEYNPFSLESRLSKGIGAGAKAAASEIADQAKTNVLMELVSSVLTPAKYLLGGYFLYKTIKYFMKKHKENKELRELNRKVWLENHLLAQRV